MKHTYYLILLLVIYSCKNAADNNKSQRPVNTPDTTVVPCNPVFFKSSLFSYNATSTATFGDTLYTREIDHYLKAHRGDGTTQGDVESYYRASQKLDTLIEAVYYEIYQKLNTEQDKKLFKTAQENWEKYMASETKFLHEVYYTQKPGYGFGKEHAITQAQWAFQVSRQRLLLLKNINEQIYTSEAETPIHK